MHGECPPRVQVHLSQGAGIRFSEGYYGEDGSQFEIGFFFVVSVFLDVGEYGADGFTSADADLELAQFGVGKHFDR